MAPCTAHLRTSFFAAAFLLLLASPVVLRADRQFVNVGASGSVGCEKGGATSGNCSVSIPGVTSATATGSASLATGTFNAFASYTAVAGNANSIGGASTVVNFDYDFSVSGPASGTLALLVTVDGTSSVTNPGCTTCSAEADAELTYGVNEVFLSNGITPLVLAFAYSGGMVDEDFQFEVSAECNCVTGSGTVTATSDFSHTLQITGAQVFDSAGNLVPGAVVTTASGFNPNGTPASATPEPSTIFGLMFGLFCLVTGRASLRRRPRLQAI